jgi:hypothetical protein
LYRGLSRPDAAKEGKNRNLEAMERAFRAEAGEVATFTAVEEHAGRPAEPRSRSLLSDIIKLEPLRQDLRADQRIHIDAAVGARTFETVITISEARRRWLVSSIDYLAVLAKPCPAEVRAEAVGLVRELRRYRLVSEDEALAKRLNGVRRLRTALTENLRAYYHDRRISVSVSPRLVLAPHQTGCALWVRTTLLELWWTLNLVRNLGVQPFVRLCDTVEQVL